jgi:nucleotide-binding universal stress UspA family protein
MRPRDLVLRAEQAAFLEQTALDESRPGADLTLTEPGQYHVLREHIDVHRYYLGEGQAEPRTLAEAAADWYDSVYMPIVRVIRDQGLLREFPGRTETDLYLWLAEHRAELEAQLGWQISPGQAAADLAARQGGLARAGEQMLELLLPNDLAPAPPPGSWRQGRPAPADTWLFDELLVPVSGEPAGWEAVDQAIMIAQVERARLYGLHVVRDEAQREGAAARAVQAEFARRCAAADVAGQLAIEVGPVARTIRERSRWADLVVLQISYPPGPRPIERLKSGLHSLIRTSARPVLTVPQATRQLRRILLAYDATPRAEEALVLAAYLAVRWSVALTVVTVPDPKLPSVEGGIAAEFLTVSGEPAPAILSAAEQSGCDLVIMGGHGHNPVSDLLLGSVVEEVLRTSRRPTLICP